MVLPVVIKQWLLGIQDSLSMVIGVVNIMRNAGNRLNRCSRDHSWYSHSSYMMSGS